MGAALKHELIALIPALRAYALVLCRNTIECDDLVQETLRRAWRGRDGFRPGASRKAWLFGLLREASRGGLSYRWRTTSAVDDRFTRQLSSSSDRQWRMRYGEILDHLAQLPERNREALLLVGGSGLTHEEAAEVCNCSVAAVKARVSRARARLASLIDLDDLAPLPHRTRAALNA
jgi:RNA polymerase sigma-70 factor (ECF subfamily)